MTTRTKDNTTGKGMVLTERDRRIISTVADFGILSRVQIARYLRFGSVTRVNAVLLRLTRHGYLTRRLQPTLRGTRRQTYLLGPQGAELLSGPSETRRIVRRRWRDVSDLFVEHRLLVNDVRFALQDAAAEGYQFRQWRSESELRELNLGIVPDGYAEYELRGKSYAVFLEADNGTETLGRWHHTIRQYVDLAFTGHFQAAFNRQYFRVLVLTPSGRRLNNIRREVARQTDKIFRFATFDELATNGILAAIWRTPTSESPQFLTSQLFI